VTGFSRVVRYWAYLSNVNYAHCDRELIAAYLVDLAPEFNNLEIDFLVLEEGTTKGGVKTIPILASTPGNDSGVIKFILSGRDSEDDAFRFCIVREPGVY
jgi:hypothetical protein